MAILLHILYFGIIIFILLAFWDHMGALLGPGPGPWALWAMGQDHGPWARTMGPWALGLDHGPYGPGQDHGPYGPGQDHAAGDVDIFF